MKGKLVIGLVTAGLFVAGFGGAVLPAAAEPHHFLLKLANGTTVPWDGEPGAAPPTVPVSGVPVAVIGIQDLGAIPPAPAPTSAAPAPATTPAPTTTPAPAATPAASTPAATTPAATTPAKPAKPKSTPKPKAPANTDEPVGGRQTQQKTTADKAKSQAADEASRKAKAKATARRRKAAKDDAATTPAPATTPATTTTPSTAPAPTTTATPPAPSDPTYSLAQPGPAPVGVPNFFIDKFRIPPFLLPIYQAAGIEYGVRWEILAAINEIETDYGRNLNVSSAGALGWMQFMPATWAMYGTDANGDGERDPYNPVDAIFAAARYLKAAGADQDINRAIFAYNHANWYVDSVLMRARLIGGLPADLVGSLTGLTQGHFPVHAEARYAERISPRKARTRVAAGTNAAVPVESSTARRGIDIYAKAGSPVIAVQDGRIVNKGYTPRLGRFVQLRDAYGNTYTYGHLKTIARRYPVPKSRTVTARQVDSELHLGARATDPKPTAPATAGAQPTKKPVKASATVKARVAAPSVTKERLFANPYRPRAYKSGGETQLFHDGAAIPGFSTFRSFFTEIYGLQRNDVELAPLTVGAKVIAGTILGRLGRVDRSAPRVRFEIRPAGAKAPRIDPKPIIDGWKLLESTAIYRAAGKNPLVGADATSPTIGQVLLMSKETLQRRVLRSPNITIYGCGRRDIKAGQIDRRVLATLEFLSASGLKPTVSSLHCGHSYLTKSGNVSEHSTGTAVDIAAINGIPIYGHQGPGSITDVTIRRLLTLQGTMKPHQIISLMAFAGTDNTLVLADHDDHIHVGFRPLFGSNPRLSSQLNAVLQPGQWTKLMDRLGSIQNPTVRVAPSKYSVAVKGRSAHGD